jgi:hypothetical protein
VQDAPSGVEKVFMALRTARRFAVPFLAAVVTASLASPAAADNVINDDLIGQSSACIGLYCADGENFGTDTLRLKEDNTRLNFTDTSVNAGFASTDWTLLANEQPSGGRNIFMLQDITAATNPFAVLGGAPTNSLFVHSTGQIGVGTDAPGRLLHLRNNNQPGIRLEQDNSNGFTAQTWDVTGDEASFGVRDVTGGGRLPFRIRPGAPTSALEVKASGEVATGGALTQAADQFEQPGTVTASETLDKIDSIAIGTYQLAGDTTRHVGPSGADFRAAFGVGADDATIAPADLAGVSLLGVQALDDRVDALEARPGGTDFTARVEGAEGKITAAEGRIGTAEGRIAELLRAVEPLGPLGTRVTQLAAFDTTADKRLTALEKKNKSLASSNKKLSKRLRALEKKMKRR